MADAFGRALRDFHRGEMDEPLLQIDGDDVYEHPVEAFYFEPRDSDGFYDRFESDVAGPLLDMGAGVGRDALYFQDDVETVAIEVSERLVEVMADRGVADARLADMFALPDAFSPARFRTVRSFGTQATLARSPGQLRAFLDDLALVTTDDGRAILDGYDPRTDHTEALLGYRDVPEAGVGFRVFHFEYEGERGETLLFRLVSPDRVRDACADSDWSVADIRYTNDHHYEVVLEKQ